MLSQLNEWSSYFSAMCGAAATLTGLIFVGASISLQRILATPALSSRVLESLLLLIIIVVVSSLCLVPRQTFESMGIEILCVGIVLWIITLRIDIKMLTNIYPQYKRHYRRNIVFTQLAVLPYIIAGLALLHNGAIGVYFIIPAILFSFFKSLSDAWVLLIEINR